MRTAVCRFVIFNAAILSLVTCAARKSIADEPTIKSSPTAEIAEDLRRYPLSDSLRVLAEDATSPAYRKLVNEMLATDLAAEWQRVETQDNADRFLEQHGGREKVVADPVLKRAYERRVEIRAKFLDVMRAGFKRVNKPAPFDSGAKAESAGTRQGQVVAGVQLSVVLPAPGAENQWPGFRGPGGQGISHTKGLPLHWNKQSSENIVWRTSLPGSGNSSPVIWGDRILLTSAGKAGVDRSLHGLRRSDGKLLWTCKAPPHEVEPNVRDKNGFASATPVTDGERVVAFLGAGGLLCCDMEGKQVWHHPLKGFNTTWGTGSSPLLYRNLVILAQDQNKADSLFIAVDKSSGKFIWQQKREKSMGWSTPVVVHVGDHDELLYAGGQTVKGYDPLTGKELWTLKGTTVEVIPNLIVGEKLVYSASGRQGPTLGVRPGGSGDVSESHLAWRATRGGPHVPSPILYQGRLYTVNDTGIATCLDATSGEMIWQSRINGKFSASPIESEGLLYCCSEEGITYILRAGDKLDIVAENDLGAPILASPAALDGRLYIRTAEELVCLGSK